MILTITTQMNSSIVTIKEKFATRIFHVIFDAITLLHACNIRVWSKLSLADCSYAVPTPECRFHIRPSPACMCASPARERLAMQPTTSLFLIVFILGFRFFQEAYPPFLVLFNLNSFLQPFLETYLLTKTPEGVRDATTQARRLIACLVLLHLHACCQHVQAHEPETKGMIVRLCHLESLFLDVVAGVCWRRDEQAIYEIYPRVEVAVIDHFFQILLNGPAFCCRELGSHFVQRDAAERYKVLYDALLPDTVVDGAQYLGKIDVEEVVVSVALEHFETGAVLGIAEEVDGATDVRLELKEVAELAVSENLVLQLAAVHVGECAEPAIDGNIIG